jgi:hypothetical protein
VATSVPPSQGEELSGCGELGWQENVAALKDSAISSATLYRAILDAMIFAGELPVGVAMGRG